MSSTRQYKLDRASRDRLAAIWRPEYDRVASYNAERARGLQHDPDYVARMEAAQRDYDENYLPAAAVIWAAAKRRRVWGS